MKVWITAGALLKGVVVTEARPVNNRPGWISIGDGHCFGPGDWCATEAEALARVAEMLDRRLILLCEWTDQARTRRQMVRMGQLPLAPGDDI